MVLNIDSSIFLTDWLKPNSWDLPTDVESFLNAIGGIEKLDHFMELPAAEAMPASLRGELLHVEATQLIEKHLAGKHDQSSHAGGRAAAVETKPALRSFAKADWGSLPQATVENLSIDEQVALMAYQQNGDKGINRYLRGEILGLSGAMYSGDANALTEAVNRFTIDEDIVVKRGVDASAFGLLERSRTTDFLALKGKAFTDKGFLSTAAFTNGSKVIANPVFDTKIIQMAISVPKGSKGMAHNPLEGELTLPPNTTLFISDVRETNNGYEVDAEVIGQ